MSFSPSIDNAIQFNADGVQKILTGCFNEAARALNSALTSFQEELVQESGPDRLSSQEFIFSFLHDRDVLPPREDEDDDTATFRSPITVTARQNAPLDNNDGANKLFHTRFAFSVLYNLALSFHLGATLPGHKLSARKLRKARTFYLLAYSMLEQEEDSIQYTSKAIAIINNLIEVHMTLGDNEKARLCAEELLSLLLSIENTEEAGSVHQFDRFLFHALETLLPSAKGAAAA